jgi:hypothetical protein
VPIQPIPAPAGAQVVDVTEFATLARIAEHHGLLVMYWTRSDVTTFVVHDEATTHRYRCGSQDPAPEPSDVGRGYPRQAQPRPRARRDADLENTHERS